jgi:putative redox protein
MNTINSKYLGDLRTQAVHVKSGNLLITDAPTDNYGKGEAFSPTDLLCTALGSCMMTMMGIYARKEQLDLDDLSIEITKYMSNSPRKISAVDVNFSWPKPVGSHEQREKLKHIARTCPVALSLHESVEQNIEFGF